MPVKDTKTKEIKLFELLMSTGAFSVLTYEICHNILLGIVAQILVS